MRELERKNEKNKTECPNRKEKKKKKYKIRNKIIKLERINKKLRKTKKNVQIVENPPQKIKENNKQKSLNLREFKEKQRVFLKSLNLTTNRKKKTVKRNGNRRIKKKLNKY